MLQNLFAHLGSKFGDGCFRSFCREKRGDRSSVTHHTRAGIFGFSVVPFRLTDTLLRDETGREDVGEDLMRHSFEKQHMINIVFFQPDISRDFPLLGTWNMTLWSSGKSKRQWHS